VEYVHGQDWRLFVTVSFDSLWPRISRVVIEPTGGNPNASITSALMRDVPWGDVFGVARHSTRGEPGAESEIVYKPLSDALAKLDAKGRIGKRGELFHLRRAIDYLRLVSQGEETPIQVLAGVYEVSSATAANWIRQARGKYGLLGTAGAGRPGGALTRRAVERLKEVLDG